MEKSELMLVVRKVDDKKVDIRREIHGSTHEIADYYVRVSTDFLKDFAEIDANAPRIILEALVDRFGFKLVEK